MPKQAGQEASASEPKTVSPGTEEAAPDQQAANSAGLSGGLVEKPESPTGFVDRSPRMPVDDARTAAAGIRKLVGNHLTLYTDLPSREEIDCLPEVFDQAFPQWCQYFKIDPAACADWAMTGFLMRDKARFQRAGVLPERLPPFLHGFTWNHELWLYDQPSDYYRRHLLLHEGTHGLMYTRLGGCGPPWYMEGVAELLATHRWRDGRLRLNYLPVNRDEVPEWGRIRIIKDAVEAHREKGLKEVIEYPSANRSETEFYAWCWALATLFDRHPRYQARFRSLYQHVLDRDFSERFYRLLENDWQELAEEWQLFLSGLEYGYDVARTGIDFTPGQPLPAGVSAVTVAADRGWQNSRLRLEGGVKYRLRAQGRYQVAQEPQVWWCEPNGVSIRYYQGRPLGLLLAAVRPENPEPNNPSALLHPSEAGSETTLTPEQSGTLFLKINDSAAELDDNAGGLKVEIKRE
jgi:hypothetical protein